ncbi:MAG: hypothetical protein ABEJ82_07110 [Haloplanus sp.]
MRRAGSGATGWHRALVVGVVLAVLVTPATAGAATATDGASATDTGETAALGGPVAPAMGGLPTAPWVNQSDTSYDPTTTTSLNVAYNATGQVPAPPTWESKCSTPATAPSSPPTPPSEARRGRRR